MGDGGGPFLGHAEGGGSLTFTMGIPPTTKDMVWEKWSVKINVDIEQTWHFPNMSSTVFFCTVSPPQQASNSNF